MDFVFKAILSFIVGGASVSIVVWTSEHLGSHIGGAIAGIPTTIFISLAFICFTEGSSVAKSSSVIIPVMLLVGLLYAFLFVRSAQLIKTTYNKHLIATFLAALAWLLAATTVRLILPKASLYITVSVSIIGVLIAHYLFKNLRSAKPKKIKLSNNIYFVRFLIAGTVIVGAVLAAKLLGSVWGGVVSSFPATFSTSLYFLNKSQGCAFAEGFAKRLPLSVISTVVFIILLHSTLTHVPAALSFLLGMLGSLVYTYTLLAINKPTVSVVEQTD